jgi:hypothetical protein
MKLVENSSGQFIYAATVMRFIETPSNTPQVQLEIVLSLRAEDLESPFGPLDALYTRALMSSTKSRLAFIWLRAYQIVITDTDFRLRVGFQLPLRVFNRGSTAGPWISTFAHQISKLDNGELHLLS